MIISCPPSGRIPLVTMGMVQNSDYQGQPNNTWYELPSWSISQYPGTVRSGNGIRITGTGLAKVTVRTATSSSTGNRLGRFKINDVPYDPSTMLSGNNPHTQVWQNVPLEVGDIVVPEYINNGSISTQRTFTSCLITIEPMG